MKTYVLDFETYYDTVARYSLGSKDMTTESYVRDPRFEAIMLGIYDVDTGEAWAAVGDKEIRAELKALKLHKCAVAAHNNKFDGFILYDRYGIEAREYICTLMMSRPLHGSREANSLAKLAKRYGLKDKGTAITQANGKRLIDFSPRELDEYIDYCLHDCALSWQLYQKFRPHYSKQDMITISDTLRAHCVPLLDVDVPLLQEYIPRLEKEQEQRLQAVLELVGYRDLPTLARDLRSGPKFAALLESLGYDVPMKESKTAKHEDGTPKQTYAFAKNDWAFKSMLDSDDETLSLLCHARIGEKSTINQTRAQRYIEIGQRGRFPFSLEPLNAQTTRWTAGTGDKVNCFTPGHELFTPEGWVRVEDFSGEPLCQWHPESGDLSWDYSPAWLVKDHDGMVVSIDAPMMSLEVTPEHRLVSRRCVGAKGGEPYFYAADMTAGTLLGKYGLAGIPCAGTLDKPGRQGAPITDDEVRYLVALAADGTVREQVNGEAHTFGFRRPRKVQRCRALLQRLGWAYTESQPNGAGTVTFYVAQNAASEAVRHIGKGLGAWCVQLSFAQRQVLIDELRHWDGGSNHRSKQLTFYTTQHDEAQWVQTIAAITGYAARVYCYPRSGRGTGDAIHVYFRQTEYTRVVTSKHVREAHYRGKVYCPRVDTGYVLVRRGGRISVVGQCQNMSKRGGDTTLRQSLRAPKGFVVATCDLAQIEARRNAAHAGQVDVVEAFREGRDIYCEFATEVYGTLITKNDKQERTVGKEGVLSLGFKAWYHTFRTRLWTAYGIRISEDFAKEVVLKYRARMNKIVELWEICDTAMWVMVNGGEQFWFGAEQDYMAEKGAITLPDGWRMVYEDIQVNGEDDFGRPVVTYIDRVKRSRRRLTQGIICNNITQGSSARILQWQFAKIRGEGFPFTGTVHDEGIWVVPEDALPDLYDVVTYWMKRTPKWARGTPVDAEFSIGRDYGNQVECEDYDAVEAALDTMRRRS